MRTKTTPEYRRSVAAVYGDAQRWRRSERIIAAVYIVFGLIMAGESVYRGRNHDFWNALMPLLLASTFRPRIDRDPPGRVKIDSLDDRADFRFGKAFDDLPASDHEALMREARNQSALFAAPALAVGSKYPGVLPDLRYAALTKKAGLGLVAALLLLVSMKAAAHFAPQESIFAAVADPGRPWFWAVFLAGLLPLAALMVRGPRVIRAQSIH